MSTTVYLTSIEEGFKKMSSVTRIQLLFNMNSY